jgi:hypothetical protein
VNPIGVFPLENRSFRNGQTTVCRYGFNEMSDCTIHKLAPTFPPIDKGRFDHFSSSDRLSSRQALLLLPPCLPISLFSSAVFHFSQPLVLFPAAHPALSPPASRTRPPRTAAASVHRLPRRAVARLCLPDPPGCSRACISRSLLE